MIAITNKSAYEICVIYKGDKCIEKCNNNEKLVINNEGKNYCKLNNNCPKYYSLPDNNCVDFCNTINYFINETEKICGFCRDFFPDRQYKILGQNECFEKKLEHSYFIDENLKIIDYCNNQCKTCSDRNRCVKCYDGYFLVDDNCKSYLYIYILISIIIFIGIIILSFFLIKCIISKKNKRYEESLLKKINDELKQNSNE